MWNGDEGLRGHGKMVEKSLNPKVKMRSVEV